MNRSKVTLFILAILHFWQLAWAQNTQLIIRYDSIHNPFVASGGMVVSQKGTAS